MKISTLLFITGLVPAAVVAGPAPKPNPEPEPALQAPKPVPPVDKPIKCILQGDVDSKKVPAQCGPSAGKFKKGTTVFFTCNIATDTYVLLVLYKDKQVIYLYTEILQNLAQGWIWTIFYGAFYC
jgi:hypothetical protein